MGIFNLFKTVSSKNIKKEDNEYKSDKNRLKNTITQILKSQIKIRQELKIIEIDFNLVTQDKTKLYQEFNKLKALSPHLIDINNQVEGCKYLIKEQEKEVIKIHKDYDLLKKNIERQFVK